MALDEIKYMGDNGRYGNIIYEMVEYAEEEKRKTVGEEQQYWQGRADMGRIVLALAFDGVAFGLRSGQSAEKFTDLDHDIIDYITQRKN